MPGITPPPGFSKERPRPAKKVRMGSNWWVTQEEYERIMRADKVRCPRCGGRMVPRGPKDKRFYGCVRYDSPLRCRFTLSWDEV
jgi:DNA-directed RNA polymerase subunit RPC12/RpoP